MTKFLVETSLWPEEAEKLLNDALTGISHTVTRVDVIGEVVSDCNGYPWKKIVHRYDRDVAQLSEGSPVYGEVR